MKRDWAEWALFVAIAINFTWLFAESYEIGTFISYPDSWRTAETLMSDAAFTLMLVTTYALIINYPRRPCRIPRVELCRTT